MSAKQYRLIAGVEDEGARLDRFLAAQIEDFSRSVLRKIIDLGGVHVAGRRVFRCSHSVRAGETVEVFLDGLPLEPFVLGINHIVYRDRFLLAVNKPAEVEIQPTPARYRGTLYEALLKFLHDPFRPLDRPSLGMVQRLDRDTSGVVIFSIHQRAHRGLTLAMTGREMKKVYLALVAGDPPEAEVEIRSQLARSRTGNRVKSVERGGKEAITRYRKLEQFGGAALLEINILTGRSHQIRAHLSEAGHPLLGDRRYRGPVEVGGMPVPRQMLHAWRLGLRHPVEENRLELEAPLPEDFQLLLGRLRQEVRDIL